MELKLKQLSLFLFGNLWQHHAVKNSVPFLIAANDKQRFLKIRTFWDFSDACFCFFSSTKNLQKYSNGEYTILNILRQKNSNVPNVFRWPSFFWTKIDETFLKSISSSRFL